MKLLFAYIFLMMQIYSPAFALVGKGAYDPTTPKTIEQLYAPANQLTKIADKRFLIETGNSNWLVNPGFEAMPFNLGWNTSVGQSGAAEISSGLQSQGSKALRLTVLAGFFTGAEVLYSDISTIPVDSTSTNIDGYIKVKNSKPGYKFCINLLSSTNVLENQSCIPLSTTGQYQNHSVGGFRGGAAGKKYYLSIVKDGTIAVGSPETLDIDEAYAGPSTRLGSIGPQAQSVGTIKYVGIANCIWLSNATTFSNFPADTDCNTPVVSGLAQAPATKIPAITFPRLEPGKYQIVAKGTFGINNTTNTAIQWRFSDGTRSSSGLQIYTVATPASPMTNVIGELNYSSAATNVTINLQSAIGNNAGSAQIGATFPDYSDLEISVYYFPTSSETVASVDNNDFSRPGVTITTQGLGALTNQNCTLSKRGVFAKVSCGANVGTTTAVEGRIYLPDGLTIKTGRVNHKVGTYTRANATAVNRKRLVIMAQGGNSYVTLGNDEHAIGASPFQAVNGDAISITGEYVDFNFEVEVNQYQSSNGVIRIDPPIKNVIRYTSGSGTYTPGPNVKWYEVELIGAGSGGAGSSATPQAGSNGGNTTFGTSLLIAGGGVAGSYQPGAGGACTVNSPAITIVANTGAQGTGSNYGANTATYAGGGAGAATPFGGGGAGTYGQAGLPAVANTGAGGGAAGTAATSGSPGSGGSAGCYIKAYIINPTGSYPWTVGTGGSGGTGAFYNGGAGSSGIIIITEHYTSWDAALASGALQKTPGSVTTTGSKDLVSRFTMPTACTTNGTCTLTDSSNVTSVVRSGTGIFSVNFTTAYPVSPSGSCTIAGNLNGNYIRDGATTGASYAVGVVASGVRTDLPLECIFIGPRP